LIVSGDPDNATESHQDRAGDWRRRHHRRQSPGDLCLPGITTRW